MSLGKQRYIHNSNSILASGVSKYLSQRCTYIYKLCMLLDKIAVRLF